MIVISYYVAINLVTFVLMYYDKFASKSNILSKYRIRERNLLWFSICGGCIGALVAMNLFRHKTKHDNFIIIFWMSLFAHVIFWGLIFNNFFI